MNHSTPEEKAKELVNKMFTQLPVANVSDNFSLYHAKLCALVAIEEIIKSMGTSNVNETSVYYWQEVKQALQRQE